MEILKLTLLTFAISVATHTVVAQAGEEGYRLVDLKVDTLPALNVARSGHATFCLDGELTVLGGHTGGFIPTATAEYFRDGAWHVVPLAYPHDNGIALGLRSGKVILAGGHKEPLGIGRTYSMEMYDPAEHASRGFGCMDRKRAYGNAMEIADGEVVISGNWFADDGIEMFYNVYDPKTTNARRVKDVSIPRSTPYILRIADNDAIIFGSIDNKANSIDCGIVDRLSGPSYREPFLDTWHPLRTINVMRSTNHFIGDEAEGRYEWLLPVENVEIGRVALARVSGPTAEDENPTFSLLPTRHPLPDSINGKRIVYSSLVCDRSRATAYLIGDDDDGRIFVAAIQYEAPDSVPLTIYATDPQPLLVRDNTPVVTPEGDLVFAGGGFTNNFTPENMVIRLPLGAPREDGGQVAEAAHSHATWLWISISCLLAGAVAAFVAVARRRKLAKTPVLPVTGEEVPRAGDSRTEDEAPVELFKRIERLMEDEQLYLNPNLRVSDVAALVGSNTAYVSAAINSQRGCSFTQFLTIYRIAYAQQLMREDPEMKISSVSTHAGFNTDSTFFRAFRAVTGMSPKEWLASKSD